MSKLSHKLFSSAWPAVRHLIFLCAALAFAGDRAEPPVIALARTAPPEFFADAVVRLIHAGKIPNRDQEIELLEDAFAAAATAKEPVRLIAVTGTPPDTRELYRSKAGELGFDALSLQSRIIAEMAKLDAAKARELFDRIARPKLDVRPCADALVPEISTYYDAAAEIVQSSFTAREKESELHVEFLNALLAEAQSPNEIAAFARAMQSAALTKEQSRYLISSIAAKLELVRADYRPFAMSLDSLQSELWKLIEANRPARDEIVRSLRIYITNQLKAPRCAPELALGLNEITWLQPRIVEDDIQPSKRGEPFKAHPYFQSEDASWIADGLRRLAAKPSDENSLSDFLHGLEAWKPQGSAADIFHQRATIYRALLQTAAGSNRQTVLDLAIAFLQSSEVERQNPAEWMWEVRAIHDVSSSNRAAFESAMRSSPNVSLSLYSALGYFCGDSSGTSK